MCHVLVGRKLSQEGTEGRWVGERSMVEFLGWGLFAGKAGCKAE